MERKLKGIYQVKETAEKEPEVKEVEANVGAVDTTAESQVEKKAEKVDWKEKLKAIWSDKKKRMGIIGIVTIGGVLLVTGIAGNATITKNTDELYSVGVKVKVNDADKNAQLTAASKDCYAFVAIQTNGRFTKGQIASGWRLLSRGLVDGQETYIFAYSGKGVAGTLEKIEAGTDAQKLFSSDDVVVEADHTVKFYTIAADEIESQSFYSGQNADGTIDSAVVWNKIAEKNNSLSDTVIAGASKDGLNLSGN